MRKTSSSIFVTKILVLVNFRCARVQFSNERPEAIIATMNCVAIKFSSRSFIRKYFLQMQKKKQKQNKMERQILYYDELWLTLFRQFFEIDRLMAFIYYFFWVEWVMKSVTTETKWTCCVTDSTVQNINIKKFSE